MYDTLIIGSGPAGMTAGLYAARANLKVGIIEQGAPGGQMNNTSEIENYPGYDHISGPELSMKMHAPLEKFGVENIYGIVKSIEDAGDVKRVITEDATYEAKTIILATGAKNRALGVAGEEEYTSRGVSYCAVCDGAFFKGKHLIVVGGGDAAVEEGVYLTQLASKVTVLVRRDELRAEPIIQAEAMNNDKIEFVYNTSVTEIVGDDIKVTGVKTHNNKTGEDGEMAADGVFIYVGNFPMTAAFKNLDILDDQGWVKTDERMRTAVPGIFAIGDVRETPLRQVATAVGDGAIAGQQVYQYIKSMA